MTRRLQPFLIEYTTADGLTHQTLLHTYTATDAVRMMGSYESEFASDAHRMIHSRLAPITAGRLTRAAYAVARDQIQGVDEWIEQGFVMVHDAVAHVRNILRLPEDPPVPGGYPIDDDGGELATAYRRVLEATPAELAAAIGPDASVRAR